MSSAAQRKVLEHDWVCLQGSFSGPCIFTCTKCGVEATKYELDKYDYIGCNEQKPSTEDSDRIL
jgi:hypothetical protein